MKFEKYLTDSDKSVLAKISDITDELGPDFRAMIDTVFGTRGELVTADDMAVFTDALNVARAYALANEASQEALWGVARGVRRRIRREINHRARICKAKDRYRDAVLSTETQAGQSAS